MVGGGYVSMDKGPVNSTLYDWVKNPSLEGAPWVRTGQWDICATDSVNYDFLSESDIEILEAVDEKYGHFTFKQLVDATHETECWQETNPEISGSKSEELPYDKIIATFCDADMAVIIRDE